MSRRRGPRRPEHDVRRYFRGPVFWIVVVVVARPRRRPAADRLRRLQEGRHLRASSPQIQHGNVSSATNIGTRPAIQLDAEERGRRRQRIQAQYVEANGDYDRPARCATQEVPFDDQIPQQSVWAEPAGQPAADRASSSCCSSS